MHSERQVPEEVINQAPTARRETATVREQRERGQSFKAFWQQNEGAIDLGRPVPIPSEERTLDAPTRLRRWAEQYLGVRVEVDTHTSRLSHFSPGSWRKKPAMRVGPLFDDLFHEAAHYLVATPQERRRDNFGLDLNKKDGVPAQAVDRECHSKLLELFLRIKSGQIHFDDDQAIGERITMIMLSRMELPPTQIPGGQVLMDILTSMVQENDHSPSFN